jgi:tRNA A-37 threonylcarbamoyl transferase component Bud32
MGLEAACGFRGPDPPDAGIRRRLTTEARAAASIHHPNICTVFEIDEERRFLAMELVEGVTLDDRIAGRPLPFAEACELAQ